MTANGECSEFILVEPKRITVNTLEGKLVPDGTPGATPAELDRFSIGNLAGWTMALDDMMAKGFDGLRYDDETTIECIGVQKATERGKSDMPEFNVTVKR